jgi:hypothetical protein
LKKSPSLARTNSTCGNYPLPDTRNPPAPGDAEGLLPFSCWLVLAVLFGDDRDFAFERVADTVGNVDINVLVEGQVAECSVPRGWESDIVVLLLGWGWFQIQSGF